MAHLGLAMNIFRKSFRLTLLVLARFEWLILVGYKYFLEIFQVDSFGSSWLGWLTEALLAHALPVPQCLAARHWALVVLGKMKISKD